jgi:hypothetical protein
MLSKLIAIVPFCIIIYLYIISTFDEKTYIINLRAWPVGLSKNFVGYVLNPNDGLFRGPLEKCRMISALEYDSGHGSYLKYNKNDLFYYADENRMPHSFYDDNLYVSGLDCLEQSGAHMSRAIILRDKYASEKYFNKLSERSRLRFAMCLVDYADLLHSYGHRRFCSSFSGKILICELGDSDCKVVDRNSDNLPIVKIIFP